MRAAGQNGASNNERQQVERLRGIARNLIPPAARFNDEAKRWRWEVNLISSKSVNAFCMPGGKIAFFTGINNGKFRRPVVPGDQIRFEVARRAKRFNTFLLHGRALVGGVLAAEAELSLARVDRQAEGDGENGKSEGEVGSEAA